MPIPGERGDKSLSPSKKGEFPLPMTVNNKMEHKQEVVYVICSSGVRVERFELSRHVAIDPKSIVSTVPPYPQDGHPNNECP